MKFGVPVGVEITHKPIPTELCLAKCHKAPLQVLLINTLKQMVDS